MDAILDEIRAERARQDKRWGIQNHHPFKWLTIMGEETGEVAKDALEGYRAGYRKELIQVAAVAVAAIESLDREVTA